MTFARVMSCLAAMQLLAGVDRLGAQAMLGDPTVDSAAVARTAYREAASESSRERTVALLQRAATAWPSQSAYWVALARIAARSADTTTVVRALNHLTALGLGGTVANDSALLRLAAAPDVARARLRLVDATRPVARGRVIATLDDSTVFAEGVDANPRDDALYVASVRHRTVYEVDASGHVRDLRVGRAPDVGAMFGVRVSRDGQSVYLTTAGHPVLVADGRQQRVVPALLRVRIRDGAVEGRWPLPDSTMEHMPGDLAIADDGTVIVTDSFTPLLYLFSPATQHWRVVSDQRFRSLQGIAPVAGTDETIVADYSHGLFVLTLGSGAVRRLTDADGISALGIDGMVWDGDAIVAVQNGADPARVVRIRLDTARTAVRELTVLDQQPALADQPTIVTRWRGGFVYVANSQWEQFDDHGARRTGTVLSPTRLLCVPVRGAACEVRRP